VDKISYPILIIKKVNYFDLAFHLPTVYQYAID